ncbi:hypothetical protein [Natrinema halophilum]|uniref:Uncharacterized protein n=1 Tax=Natrinema halophilum TaxID=1699371 RepID=A0A7D5GHJ3_9EURY|nr:hypothetical protein [Natrinema halophilum]QLG49027.1 hypothetical protein HYG82_09295 [Natrinema halophilum]
MGSATLSRWETVEQWSPTLFLLGGCLMAGHAALSGIRAFTELATPPDVFVTVGHFVALVGLLGLYPVLVDRTPVVARIARAVLVVAAASWCVMTGTQLLALAGIVASLEAVLPDSFFMIVLTTTILTYGLFGISALRADRQSRRVGLFVLAPGGLTVVLIVNSAIGGANAVAGVGIGGGLTLSMLALGYILRSWGGQSERTPPVGDASAG